MPEISTFRALGATTLALVLAAGCSSDGGGGTASPAMPPDSVAANCIALRGGAVANIETVPVSLSGLYEVPPVTTAGSGAGSFTVNRTTGDLSGSITVSGLSGAASAAHIHTAVAGLNGGVTVGLVADLATPGKFDVPAATVLTAPQLADFVAGRMYANAHTVANPDGEVRGPIVPGGIDLVRCVASGEFEVPSVNSVGSGISYVTVDVGSGAVAANVRTSGFTDANAAHLHQAFAGLVGGVIVPLVQTGGAGTDLWEATDTFTAGELAGFLAGEVYVNVHTPGNPGGEIRSQVVPQGLTVLRTLLAGDQQVPPVPTAATGVGYTTVDLATGAVEANARTANLVGANAAHIHQAPAGVNGPIIVGLSQPDAVGTPELWTASDTFTAGGLAAYLADETYFNVHSGIYSDGVIRGQIVQP